jgi:hypothetical protein
MNEVTNPNEAIDLEIAADEEAAESRAERGVTKEEDEAALAEEVVEVNTLEADAELEVQTPAAVGRVARHDSNLTSRAQRKNRQRGR